MNKNNIYLTGAVIYIVDILQTTVPSQIVNHESVAKRDIASEYVLLAVQLPARNRTR